MLFCSLDVSCESESGGGFLAAAFLVRNECNPSCFDPVVVFGFWFLFDLVVLLADTTRLTPGVTVAVFDLADADCFDFDLCVGFANCANAKSSPSSSLLHLGILT